MIIEAKSADVHDASIEGAIVQCMKDWAMAHPQELIDFKRQMEDYRKAAKPNNGMSPEKTLQSICEIPAKLNAQLEIRFKNWIYDPKMRRLVVQNFRIGQTKPGRYKF